MIEPADRSIGSVPHVHTASGTVHPVGCILPKPIVAASVEH